MDPTIFLGAHPAMSNGGKCEEFLVDTLDKLELPAQEHWLPFHGSLKL
jgi:hypothetical protein